MSHYYSKTQDDIKSNPSYFNFNFKGLELKFKTDNGVFSKDYIDYGSFVMLNNFKPNDINLPILDMGSGYGAIGVTVSRLYNKKVVMAEINERAFNLSIENIKNNNANCEVFNSDLYEKLDGMLFSSIITNPPIRAGKQVVYAIYDGAYKHLIDNGELWVVIQKKQGEESSKKYIEELFGNSEIIKRDKGYYILKAVKKAA